MYENIQNPNKNCFDYLWWKKYAKACDEQNIKISIESGCLTHDPAFLGDGKSHFQSSLGPQPPD